jgi:hypothetical protein
MLFIRFSQLLFSLKKLFLHGGHLVPHRGHPRLLSVSRSFLKGLVGLKKSVPKFEKNKKFEKKNFGGRLKDPNLAGL